LYDCISKKEVFIKPGLIKSKIYLRHVLQLFDVCR